MVAVGLTGWLLFLHIVGAFLLLSGAISISIFQTLAARSERPSTMAYLFGLGRYAEVAIIAGGVSVVVVGVWLAERLPYGIGEGWVVAALVLWALSTAAGILGGNRYKRARLEAERLSGAGDTATPELRALAGDAAAMWLSYLSGALVVAILVLMIWKPGS